MKRHIYWISIFIFLIALIAIFVLFQNNSIATSFYSVDELGKVDKNLRIVQLSDLHGKEFGSENFRLIKKVENLNPDIIIITGDWIDEKTTDLEAAVKTLKELDNLAPVFYIPGNHEYWSDKITYLKDILSNYELKIIQNEIIDLEVNGYKISLLGLDEVAMPSGNSEQVDLFDQLGEKYGLKIVLSHYPENYSLIGESSYMNHKFDLIFSGHAHGGQFIFPVIGGIYSPGQGFLPKFTEGIHENPNGSTDSKLVVSRGLGNSVIPLRLFNRPEIVVVDIGE